MVPLSYHWSTYILSEGIVVALICLSVVLLGLVLLALYVFILPHLLRLVDRFLVSPNTTQAKIDNPKEDEVDIEIQIAIATALHLEIVHKVENLSITMHPSQVQNTWGQSSTLRNLSKRK